MPQNGDLPKPATQVANALLKQYLYELGFEETYKAFRAELAQKNVSTHIASERYLAEALRFDYYTYLMAQLIAGSVGNKTLAFEDLDDRDCDETGK